MAISALHSASTGLSALSTQLDVVANNLANVNNTGFKRSRVNFEDLFYQEKAQPGVENANGDRRPTGISVGLGTRVAGTQLDFEQGALTQTGQPLDMAISGEGFFPVQINDEIGDGIGYTRMGTFVVNNNRQLVLGNSDGRLLEPEIVIPEGATHVSISSEGTISALLPGAAEMEEIGQIEVATFVNPAGLRQLGGNIYVPTGGSGPANFTEPGQNGAGEIKQGFVEAANVDPVKELVTLIQTQRAFEMNSQSIQAADEAMQVISNLRRF